MDKEFISLHKSTIRLQRSLEVQEFWDGEAVCDKSKSNVFPTLCKWKILQASIDVEVKNLLASKDKYKEVSGRTWTANLVEEVLKKIGGGGVPAVNGAMANGTPPKKAEPRPAKKEKKKEPIAVKVEEGKKKQSK